MARKRLEFTVHVLVARDGRQYSALCYEYNIATCAKTAKEAVLDLMAATMTYLEAFLDRGRQPKLRPASRELLLQFLDLDPQKSSFPKQEVAEALKSVIAGTAKLEAPLVYSSAKREFDMPIAGGLPRLGTGSYPVTIYA